MIKMLGRKVSFGVSVALMSLAGMVGVAAAESVAVVGNASVAQGPVSVFVKNTSGFDVAFTIKPAKGGTCQNVINSWNGYNRVASMGRVVVKSGSSAYLEVVNSLSEIECKVLNVVGAEEQNASDVGDTFMLDRLGVNSFMTVTFSVKGASAPVKGRFELYENSSYVTPNAWWHWVCNKLDQNTPRCVKNVRLDITKNSWF